MKQKVNYKVAIVFYLVIVICTLIYSNDIKQDKKSISADIGITDIQK